MSTLINKKMKRVATMNTGLYVHIPFCQSKCYYCDFLSIADNSLEDVYVSALVEELKRYSRKVKRKINTIFIGGGTPTALSVNLLSKICEVIEDNFILDKDIEWTIEVNPGTLTKSHLQIIKNTSINRVSLGLQSSCNNLLKKIGRIHTFEDWENTINDLLGIGITNINTDLMFALPSQTLHDWKCTLARVSQYPITHISAYALILEKNTKLYNDYKNGLFLITSEDVDRQMYATAKEILSSYGFFQYEISNWAKNGYKCKHNILYWTLDEYIGVGLGASGYLNNIRYTNTDDLKKYIQGIDHGTDIIKEEDVITNKMSMEEFMFLGLRMIRGICKKDFKNRYGKNIEEIYGYEINKWKNEKALIENETNIYLTNFGIDISNTVFASFL